MSRIIAEARRHIAGVARKALGEGRQSFNTLIAIIGIAARPVDRAAQALRGVADRHELDESLPVLAVPLGVVHQVQPVIAQHEIFAVRMRDLRPVAVGVILRAHRQARTAHVARARRQPPEPVIGVGDPGPRRRAEPRIGLPAAKIVAIIDVGHRAARYVLERHPVERVIAVADHLTVALPQRRPVAYRVHSHIAHDRVGDFRAFRGEVFDEALAYATLRKAEALGCPIGSREWLAEMQAKTGLALIPAKPRPKAKTS